MDDYAGGSPGQATPPASARVAAFVGLSSVLLLIFLALAHQTWVRSDVAFDQPVMLWLHSVSTPWLTAAAQFATALGGRIVLVAAVVFAAVSCARRRWGDALLVVAAVYGSSRINVTLKSVFERPRPDFWEHMTVENTYSFPSGHSMAAVSIAAPLVVLAWGTRYRWPALTAAAAYVLAVGASRVYLGVHFPSDVIAGWCLTVLWVAIVVVVVRGLTGWIQRRTQPAVE